MSTDRNLLTHTLIKNIACICLGSLQFGYHMAEMNAPEAIMSCRMSKPGSVPFKHTWFGSNGFEQCIPMDASQIGLATSIFSIGGLAGSFIIGAVADKNGRKKASLLHCFFYVLGSTLNGFSNSYYQLLFGRLIAGLGAGAALVITSLFINEIAPPNYKGLLGSMNQASVNVGILGSQVLALFWCNDNNWRYLLLTGSLLGILNFICLGLFVSESPIWLLNNGNKKQSLEVFSLLRGEETLLGTSEAEELFRQGDSGAQQGGETSQAQHTNREFNQGNSNDVAVSLKTYVLSSEFRNSRTVATGVLLLQQFCGINSIIFYGVSVLVTIFPTKAVFINFLISILNVLFTFVAAPLIDQVGRKPLLLTSVNFMGISTILMGLGIIYKSAILSILGTFTYITFFALGLGPIPFLIVSEVTQPTAKASAQSWGMTMNWIATFIVGYLFPILKSYAGGAVYFLFSGICAFTFIFIEKYVPETKGKASYEQVWGHGMRLE